MVEILTDQIFEDIVETIREFLLVLDSDLRVISASRSFYEFFKVTPEQTMGQLIYELGNKQWDIPKLRDLLETILPEKTSFDNYEVEHEFATIGRRIMLLNARQIEQAMGKERIILLAIEDITERKRLEDLLTDSEYRYRRLFETADDGILLLEKHGLKIRHANPAITATLGYSNEDCIGNELKDIGFPDDIGTVNEIMQTLNEDGIIYYKDLPLQKKTGQVVDADIYMVDKASLIQCNIRDITDRKHSERELNESLLQQKEIVKASNIGLWDWDLISNKVKYSPEWKAQIGYDEHEISDDFKEWETRVHPDDLMPTLEKIQNTIDKRKNHQVEFRFRHKNGSYRWILAQGSLFLDESGRPIKMRGSHIDITERKQSEQKLMESKQKFQSMVENIGIGVSMISLTMEVLELNRQMSEWFPDVDLRQRPICHQAFNNPPRDHLCDYCPTSKTLQDGKVHESTITTPGTGGFRNFRVISSPIFDEKGEVTAAIEMFEDITEHLNLQAQLIQAQKMESVGRLAGGVAHDYNNISSIIIGYSELALEKIEQSDPLHDDLMEIISAAKRSTDITRQLLAFARQQTIAPKVLDLNDTLESMLKMLRRLIGEDIDLAWLPGAKVWPVNIDPSQVDQILANLCVNARDAIADVGKVTIETRNISLDEDYCADHAGFVPGEYVLLSVSDDGKGMTPETLDKIFEPFFTTKSLGKGTGLGLSTVYGIVKQNNGFINVYSEPKNGTTIKIYLSRHTGQAVEAHSEKTLEFPLSRGSEVVLLVEDDASILKLGKRILEDLGYAVLSTKSPSEAARLAEEYTGEINLLITDVVMPEINGRELSKQLQTLNPDLKTLFMSGYTANVIAHRGVLEDGVCFMSKPFSKNDMAVKVREVLDEAKDSAKQ